MAKRGRPPVYGPETLELTDAYIATYELEGDPIPTIAGLAVTLGVARETVHRWLNEEDKKDFHYKVRWMLGIQERKLISGGLSNRFNSKISQLILNKHGYAEKREISGPDGGPISYQDLTDEELDRRIKQRQAQLADE